MAIDTVNDPMVRLGRRQRHLAQIRANGNLYIADCHPWAIKEGCERFDCPMRFQSIAPEAQPSDYIANCHPTGDMADILILLQKSQQVND